MTAKFRSKRPPPSRITQGQSPPNGAGLALVFGSPVRGRPEGGVPHKAREIPHETTSRHRSPKKSRLTNATEITAALSVRAEDVCRRYLPRGRKQGRYWTVGDTNGAKGRSLFVRLALRAYPRNGPTPRPTSMEICAISSVCTPVEHRYGAPWMRPSRSSHCRHPHPPMRHRRGRAALLARPQTSRQSRPRPPAQSALACPRPRRVLRRVRLRRHLAYRRRHRNRSLSTGSLGAFEPPQDPALLVIAREKDVDGRYAGNRL